MFAFSADTCGLDWVDNDAAVFIRGDGARGLDMIYMSVPNEEKGGT